jgi:hypothetical protein
METCKHKDVTIQDVEFKAQELLHIMVNLCETRMHAAEKRSSPAGDAMAEAMLAVKSSVRTFIWGSRDLI